MSTMRLNRRYNFTTYVPHVLGGEYKNCKVKAIMSDVEAVKYRDIMSLHRTLKPLITALPTNPQDCTYVLLENIDKETILLALEYIDMYSIEEVVSTNINVVIRNTTDADASIIRARLLELGYNDLSITLA